MAGNTNIIIAFVIVFAVVAVIAVFFCIVKGTDIQEKARRAERHASRRSRDRRHRDSLFTDDDSEFNGGLQYPQNAYHQFGPLQRHGHDPWYRAEGWGFG